MHNCNKDKRHDVHDCANTMRTSTTMMTMTMRMCDHRATAAGAGEGGVISIPMYILFNLIANNIFVLHKQFV